MSAGCHWCCSVIRRLWHRPRFARGVLLPGREALVLFMFSGPFPAWRVSWTLEMLQNALLAGRSGLVTFHLPCIPLIRVWPTVVAVCDGLGHTLRCLQVLQPLRDLAVLVTTADMADRIVGKTSPNLPLLSWLTGSGREARRDDVEASLFNPNRVCWLGGYSRCRASNDER